MDYSGGYVVDREKIAEWTRDYTPYEITDKDGNRVWVVRKSAKTFLEENPIEE